MAREISARKASPAESRFEICRRVAEAYINRIGPLDISARQLYESLVAASGYSGRDIKHYDPRQYTSGPIILDVRTSDSEMPDPYYAGHIPGAIHVPLQYVAAPETLACLAKARQVVICSHNGQTGGQVAALLGVLGYNTVNLRWGMSSWSSDADAAPGRYDLTRDTIWHEGSAYRTVSNRSSPVRARGSSTEVETFVLPEVNADFSQELTALATLATGYLSRGQPLNISAPEVFSQLYSDDGLLPAFAFARQKSIARQAPILLDIRDEEIYLRGHILGSLHIVWKNVFQLVNLRKLPPQRRVVVYSSTGHTSAQVTALLNLLGYQAVNLRWGIAAWSLSLPGAEIAPGRYVEAEQCMHYPTVGGFEAFIKCAT